MTAEADTLYPATQNEWREWLQANHATKTSVWLVYYKKKSTKPTIRYTEAVDEALCFGWIDSKAIPVDEESFMQFFCPRKEKSVWSKVSKEKVQRLIEESRMTSAGYASIERAKENGSWSILDDAEALVIPQDLAGSIEHPGAGQGLFLWVEPIRQAEHSAVAYTRQTSRNASKENH